MEKRKLDKDENKNISKDKNGYTFVIPNTNIGEVYIPYDEKKKKANSK